jgi:hypothetical protein
MMHLVLVGASPALQYAPVAAAAVPRLATPVMQMAHPMSVEVGGGTGRHSDFDFDPSLMVQGGSLRTWSYRSPVIEQVQVALSTDGRPLDAEVELWAGPDNTPVKMRVYGDDGLLRPFIGVIDTPRGPNTIAVRNIAQIEFPLVADVRTDGIYGPSPECLDHCIEIQGGALRTFNFEPGVDSVQIFIKTDGRPLNARIEMLQGPNNNKQVIELYTEDGCYRPFFAYLQVRADLT